MDIHTLLDTEYDDLVSLRAEAFGDDREYIDDMRDHYDGDLDVFMLSDDGAIRSSLTQFRMGDLVLSDKRISASISYAICTGKNSRGLGYGAAITLFARDRATERGEASILTPANPDLIDFYEPLGYRIMFYIESREAVARMPRDPSFKAEKLSASGYGTAREKMLRGRVHIKLSSHTLNFVKTLSFNGDGLYRLTLNGHTAYCACADDDEDRLFISELLKSDDDPHDPADYAAAIADLLDRQACRFRTPAENRSDSKEVQAMIYYSDDLPNADNAKAPYFGFPFE